jgi:hypothetical protein
MRNPASTTTAMSSSAQPSSSELACTGADVSVPLTVGLPTLTAGMGLAPATRRRSEVQAA